MLKTAKPDDDFSIYLADFANKSRIAFDLTTIFAPKTKNSARVTRQTLPANQSPNPEINTNLPYQLRNTF